MTGATGDWMLIGRVASAFGVRGEFRVELHTDFPDRFTSLERVYLGAGHEEREVEHARRQGEQVLLKLRGIDTPEAVRALGRADLYVARKDATPLPDGHFYLDDVVGMTVVTEDGRRIGEVADVLETGSNEVFVVGRGRQEVLIPAIRDAIRQLDIEGRTIVIDDWVLDVQE